MELTVQNVEAVCAFVGYYLSDAVWHSYAANSSYILH